MRWQNFQFWGNHSFNIWICPKKWQGRLELKRESRRKMKVLSLWTEPDRLSFICLQKDALIQLNYCKAFKWQSEEGCERERGRWKEGWSDLASNPGWLFDIGACFRAHQCLSLIAWALVICSKRQGEKETLSYSYFMPVQRCFIFWPCKLWQCTEMLYFVPW